MRVVRGIRLAFQAERCRFDACSPLQFFAPLAQLGERDTVTVEVRGSKPLRGAKFLS